MTIAVAMLLPPDVSLVVLGVWGYAVLSIVCAVAVILIGPWTRPVSKFRRIITALVVALLMAGPVVRLSHPRATRSALASNSCEWLDDGWMKWFCENMI